MNANQIQTHTLRSNRAGGQNNQVGSDNNDTNNNNNNKNNHFRSNKNNNSDTLSSSSSSSSSSSHTSTNSPHTIPSKHQHHQEHSHHNQHSEHHSQMHKLHYPHGTPFKYDECDANCSFFDEISEKYPIYSSNDSEYQRKLALGLDRHIHNEFNQQRRQNHGQELSNQQNQQKQQQTQQNGHNTSKYAQVYQNQQQNQHSVNYNNATMVNHKNSETKAPYQQSKMYQSPTQQQQHQQQQQLFKSPTTTQSHLEAFLGDCIEKLITTSDISQLITIIKSLIHFTAIQKDLTINYLIKNSCLFILLSRMKDCDRADEHATFLIHGLLLLRHVIYSGLTISNFSSIFFEHNLNPHHAPIYLPLIQDGDNTINNHNGTAAMRYEFGFGDENGEQKTISLHFIDIMFDIMATFRDIPEIFIPCVALLHFGAFHNPVDPNYQYYNQQKQQQTFYPKTQNNTFNNKPYHFRDEFHKPSVVSIIQSLYRLGSEMIEGLSDNRQHSIYLLQSLSTAETYFSHLGPDVHLPPSFHSQQVDEFDDLSQFSYTPKKKLLMLKKNHQNQQNQQNQQNFNQQSLLDSLSPDQLDPEKLLMDSPYIKFSTQQRQQHSMFKKFEKSQQNSTNIHAIRTWRTSTINNNNGDGAMNNSFEFGERQEQLDVYFRILASLKQLMDVVGVKPV
jgi:hypothetical protein